MWELQRPDLVLTALRRQIRFDEPSTFLMLVDRHEGVQQSAPWTLLWRDPPSKEYPDRTRLTEQALQRLGTPGFNVPYLDRPLVVPVVVRPGWHVWTFDELEAALGLRYAANRYAFRQEGPVVVTQSGWWMPFEHLSGAEPRAEWSAQALSTMARTVPASI